MIFNDLWLLSNKAYNLKNNLIVFKMANIIFF